MAKIIKLNPLAATVGAAVMASALSAPVNAAENPFATADLGHGYQVAEADMGKSDDMKGEGMSDEHKADSADKKAEGNCGDKKKDEKKDKKAEGNCGDKK